MLKVIQGRTFKREIIIPHMWTILGPKLSWFFDKDGILVFTRVARKKQERGTWGEILT